MDPRVEQFMARIKAKNPAESQFHQAVQEVAETIIPFIEEHPKYRYSKILERIAEPERIIIFRVPWMNDKGEVEINRGYRIEMNSAIGPFKGGLRFHPTVSLGVLKFLAFEQVFKNSLTTLPMGGGKGGSDFDPKGKSDNEVMKFCQSFMSELFRHIGPQTDIPAGDIGVGGREIGYLFGQYKRLKNEFTGVLTGKGIDWGGSLMRPEATGYGAVYFALEMLRLKGEDLSGKTCLVSGSGNVAQYTVQKINELGGKVVTLSDSDGFIYDPSGIDDKKLNWLMDLKNIKRGRIYEYASEFGVEYFEGEKPWKIPSDAAFPCATENEIDLESAKLLIENDCKLISEGANMPSTHEAINYYLQKRILYGPGKAANAGGVAVSGLEMTQNSMRLPWTRQEVDARLHVIMSNIHATCVKYGKENGYVNYVRGANIGGFVKVADAMLAQGIV